MTTIFNYVVNKIKERSLIFFIGLTVFLLGFLLGLFFNLPELLKETYTNFVLEIFINVLLKKSSVFTFFFMRLLNVVLLFLIAFLLCLNGALFFGIFLLIFYKACVLAVGVKICVITLKFLGFIPFIFTIFLESILVIFSLIIYAVLCYEKVKKLDGCFIEKHIKKTAICILISTAGIVVATLLLVCVFRPINFYF